MPLLRSITATISRPGATSFPLAVKWMDGWWALPLYLDNGWTLEVNRLCTTGERNACSMLYAAAARAAKAMGYRKIITYTLDSEPGASLRAAGWTCAGPAGGERWTGQRRPVADLYPAQMKLRYEKLL